MSLEGDEKRSVMDENIHIWMINWHFRMIRGGVWMKIRMNCDEGLWSKFCDGRELVLFGVIVVLPFAIPICTEEKVVSPAMELQAIAGLQQGSYSFRSLGSTGRPGRISSCGLAPLVKNSRLLGGSRGRRSGRGVVVVSCSGGEGSAETAVLKKGSAVVVTEAPPLLKTAEPMPMMRANNGLINVGDAGRIIDRRPKDTWAVRFAVGAYLIDRKYFKPLEL